MTDINEEDLTTAYMLGRHDGRKDAERRQALSTVTGSVPTTMLPPLPKKEVLHAPERREIRGYTAAQMMDYAEAAVAATWKAQNVEVEHE